MPPDRDAAFLWDMLTCAREAQEVVRGISLAKYQQDRIRQLALERVIEIIGEAANKVSPEFQQAHPQIPWRLIVAQRNVLAHQYGDIDHARIWDVATVHIPELIKLVEPLIPPLPPPVD